MSVWLCIPSKKSAADAEVVLSRWREMGYRLAIWRDAGDELVDADMDIRGEYPGYAVACNRLIRMVISSPERAGGGPDAHWFVCAGDDILPDPNKRADEIAEECEHHFAMQNGYRGSMVSMVYYRDYHPTFGVMQPTGDRWGEDPSLPNLHPMRTAYVDRVAASAWYGREYCERMYGGEGPLYFGYKHMFVDEEAWHVAKMMGVYLERRDLTQEHRHWARERRQMPAYLKAANSPQHWTESQRLFNSRKAAGFPGARPSGAGNCVGVSDYATAQAG